MIIVDRFEGEYVVAEIDGQMHNIPKTSISGEVSEGDVLVCNDGVYIKDAEKTAERRMKIRERQNRLFGK